MEEYDEQLDEVAIDCLFCAHVREGPYCDAFPSGIPTEILTGEITHREPYPGDNGIQFQNADESDSVETVRLPITSKMEEIRGHIHGESEGHPFRGNQWSSGISEGEKKLIVDGYESQKFAKTVKENMPDDFVDYETTITGLRSDALESYRGSGGAEMNDYLRHPEKKDAFYGGDPDTIMAQESFYGRMDDEVKYLDKSFKNAPSVPEDVVLWRGVGEKSGYKIANMEVGDICEDKAFQSHSIAPQVAERFSQGWFEPGWEDQPPSAKLSVHRTIIRALPGTKTKGIYGGVGGEFEVLVNRGTKWKVATKETFEQQVVRGQDPTVFHVITVVPV